MVKSSYRTADGKAQIDWELKPRKAGFVFSAQGDYEGGGGQCLDSIGELYPDDPVVKRLVQIWEAYHLNDMRAGTPAQRALGWGRGFDVALSVNSMTEPQKAALLKRNEARVSRQRSKFIAEKIANLVNSQKARKALWDELQPGKTFTVHADEDVLVAARVARGDKDATRYPYRPRDNKIMPVIHDWLTKAAEKEIPTPPVESEVFKDSLGAPCPETGHLYGHAWLFEEIPAEVVAELEELAKTYPELPSPSEDAGRAFVKKHGITMSVVRTDKNPFMDDTEHPMNHWKVTLSCEERGTKPMTLVYSMGSGLSGQPTAEDVLGTVGRDAASVKGRSFEDWCREMGDSTDSRKALRCYEAIEEQARQLEALLPAEAYEELLACDWNR